MWHLKPYLNDALLVLQLDLLEFTMTKKRVKIAFGLKENRYPRFANVAFWRCGRYSNVVRPSILIVSSISPEGFIEILLFWKICSAHFQIMHGYGVLRRYTIRSPVVENKWTAPETSWSLHAIILIGVVVHLFEGSAYSNNFSTLFLGKPFVHRSVKQLWLRSVLPATYFFPRLRSFVWLQKRQRKMQTTARQIKVKVQTNLDISYTNIFPIILLHKLHLRCNKKVELLSWLCPSTNATGAVNFTRSKRDSSFKCISERQYFFG